MAILASAARAAIDAVDRHSHFRLAIPTEIESVDELHVCEEAKTCGLVVQ